MSGLKRVLGRGVVWSVAIAGALVFTLPLYGQYAGQDALATFPADTQQMAYTNLQQLRSIPQYPLIHARLLSPQLRALETLLKSAGLNPEKDVNELVLGWRGQVTDTTRFFGLAEGTFQPEQVREYFTKAQMPIQQYDGYDLYSFGTGAVRNDFFFTFINESTGAFGHLADLKALLDVRNDERPSLSSNENFRRWEGDLEGLAPQWGIATGQAAANLAIPWLAGGKKLAFNPSALFGAVNAVLYRVNWSSGVVAHLSIRCQNDAAANGFGQLFSLLRNAQPSLKANVSPALSQLLQNLEVRVDGSEVDLNASASIAELSQLLNAPVSNPAR